MYNGIQENLHLQTASLLRSARPAGKRCALYRTYGSNESGGIANMAKLDLTKYGITGTTEIVYNPSYEQLFDEEIRMRILLSIIIHESPPKSTSTGQAFL